MKEFSPMVFSLVVQHSPAFVVPLSWPLTGPWPAHHPTADHSGRNEEALLLLRCSPIDVLEGYQLNQPTQNAILADNLSVDKKQLCMGSQVGL